MMEITSYPFFRELTALPFIDAVYLFGSRARGDADEWSDIDLAVACPRATAAEWQGLKQQVSAIRDILVPVQIIRYDSAYNGPLLAHIDAYKKTVFERHG